MRIINNIKSIPFMQKYRYSMILISSISFLGSLAFIPQMVGNDDLCGVMCMRRFYLYFPGRRSKTSVLIR